LGQVYRNKNCPPGVGGKSLAGVPEPYSTAMSPTACMQKCQSIADCQGIVVEDIASLHGWRKKRLGARLPGSGSGKM